MLGCHATKARKQRVVQFGCVHELPGPKPGQQDLASAGMNRAPDVALASRLRLARSAVMPLPSEDLEPSVRELDQARAIADILDELECEHGRIQTGWKIGLTSKPALAAFGAAEPMVGRLYADASLAAGGSFSLAQAIDPRIEGELLLEIGEPCPAAASDEELLASIAAVYPAYEIADSRIRGWPGDVRIATADNACCGWYSKSRQGLAPDRLDLANTNMRMMCNGEIVSQGSSAECLGGVLEIYRWFLAASEQAGRQIRQGDIVLTGALGPAVPIQSDAQYTLHVDGFTPLNLEVCR